MENIIRQLKSKLNQFEDIDLTERTLSNRVIMWLLEEFLGYERDDMKWESRLPSKVQNLYADIFIDAGDGKRLIIETKRYQSKLDNDDFLQLDGYLNRENVEWGLITNGREYYLLNHDIPIDRQSMRKADITAKIVMKIELGEGRKKGKNEKYLKYLSYENLFEKQTTKYYKYIAIFFSGHELSGSSREKYENTLYNFFDFYIEKGNPYIEYNNGLPRSLAEISEKDAIEFLKADRPAGRPYSGQVPKAKCAHIATMFKRMKEEGYTNENKMEKLLESVTKEFENIDNNKIIKNNLLTADNVCLILNHLEEGRKPVKVVIFILCAYYGFDRTKITDFLALKWSEDIDLKNFRFTLHGKTYPMVKKLAKCLEEIQREYKKKGVKAKYIYVTKKGTKYVPVKKDIVNTVFDEDIKKIKCEDERWNALNPQNVRAMLIFNMCESGCTLEDISYITGAPVTQILRYTTNEILEKTGKQYWKKMRKAGETYHPFREIFE